MPAISSRFGHDRRVARQPARLGGGACDRCLRGGLSVVLLTVLAACGGGGSTAVGNSPLPGGDPLSPPHANPEAGPEAIGVFAGFTGDLQWVGGEGGVGGGADGEGGVGAGGSLGQFRNALVFAILDDGTRLGPATTDAQSGLVTVKPGRTYAGSLAIELIGQGGTEYFDEAKNAWIVFPAGQKLRAHVDVIRGNIGLTPFSEAAVAHAETDLQLAQLPGAQRARESNERIRSIVNSQLPASYAIDRLDRLPVLLNPSSGKGALPDTAAGRYGTVIAALTLAASQYNPPLAAPGLNVATQLVKDLADGRLNGAGADGATLAPAEQLAYAATELPGQWVASIDTVNTRYGVDSADPPLPQVVEFGQYGLGESTFTARLMSDGRVLVTSSSGATEAPLPGRPNLPSSLLPATALFSDGSALLIRRADGSVNAIGFNGSSCGNVAGVLIPTPSFCRFGTNTGASSSTLVAAAPELSQAGGATEIVFGSSHALARLTSGAVLAWGINVSGQLGLPGPAARIAPQVVPIAGGVRSVAASLDFSLAQLIDGRVFSWGTDRLGALGRGIGGTGPGALVGTGALVQVPPGPVLLASGGELGGVVSVAAAGSSALALRVDGSVWGWGSAAQGLLSDEPAASRFLAAPVNGLKAIRKIVPLEGGVIALDEAGVVYYWGLATEQETRVLPAPLAGLPPIRDIQDRGAGNTVALGFADEMFSIGAGGAVSNQTTPNQTTPVSTR